MNVAFVVYDTRKRKLWTSNRGRMTWTGPRYAKRAWELEHNNPLEKQSRYMIRDAYVVPGEYLPWWEL